MLFPLWHSPVSPDGNTLLHYVIKQVINLRNDGIRKFNIDVQLVVADLLASAKITFINGHAGYYACGNCLLEGSRCLRHQHILYTWSDYFRAQPHIRTQENIDSCAVYAELS
ncbi:unnamed protein product, partial [Rotaria sp. Silwood2]